MFDTDGVLIFVVSLPLLQVITQETKEFTPRFAQTALFIIALVTMPLFIPLNFLEDPKQLALPSFKLSTNDSLLTKYNLMQLLITILDRFIDMCFDLKHTIPLILHLVLLHRFHHHREHFNDVHVPLQFSVRTNASGIGYTYAHPHTHAHTLLHAHTYSLLHAHTHSHAPARLHTHARTLSHACTCTLTHGILTILMLVTVDHIIQGILDDFVDKTLNTFVTTCSNQTELIIQKKMAESKKNNEKNSTVSTNKSFTIHSNKSTVRRARRKQADSSHTQFVHSLLIIPLAHILRIVPTAHIVHIVPTAHILRIVPSAHIVHIVPSAHIVHIVPSAHILRIVPTAHIVHIVPSAHILRIVPSAHILRIVPLAHIVHIVPSAHILRIVPTAHIVHIVASAHILRIVPSAHILRIVPSRTSFASSLPRTSFASSLPRTSFTSSLPRTSFASSPRPQRSHRSSLAISDLFHLLVSSLFIQIAQNLIASNLSLSQRIVGLGKEQKTIMITTTSPLCVPTLQLIHDCVVAAINIVHVLRSSNGDTLPFDAVEPAKTKRGKKLSLAPLSPAKHVPSMTPRKQRSKRNMQPVTEHDVEKQQKEMERRVVEQARKFNKYISSQVGTVASLTAANENTDGQKSVLD
ncbi:hypothetical protein BLNAU_16561 [Blattamonas nauphoetae]|uniref:Uncharacterized protein n=2 Tax=Blattamonas nauphoetae TaxID=2049346 RepID=A0ABQ9XCW7_9EUKA|nr:hypothetical protein BLNAU_16561 [Blattamonas nauphoetae]